MSFDSKAARVLMDITERPPIVFVRGQGTWLWDQEGKRYLDFVQGWAVNCLGHSPEVISQVLADQAQRLITASPAFYNEPSMELARRIVEQSCFDRVFFTNSGAEANEGAIKLARKWGSINRNGGYEIITFHDSFHGRTLATMSATGKARFKELFEPKVPGFPKATLNDIGSVKRLISEQTVAVMLETVQGEGGVVIAENTFLSQLRELTRECDLLLIVDEIQTGVGRTGKLWGYQHAAIEPDIMTLGKMLGGGVPLAALVAREEVCCFEHGDQGGTFNGNPLMTAVGSAVIDAVLEPGFLEQVKAMSSYLVAGLTELSDRYMLGEVRGLGLLIGLELLEDIAGEIVDKAREAGLLLNAPRPDLLRFLPPLNLSRQEADEMLTLLDRVLGQALNRSMKG